MLLLFMLKEVLFLVFFLLILIYCKKEKIDNNLGMHGVIIYLMCA